jgi:hypothetical protein
MSDVSEVYRKKYLGTFFKKVTSSQSGIRKLDLILFNKFRSQKK